MQGGFVVVGSTVVVVVVVVVVVLAWHSTQTGSSGVHSEQENEGSGHIQSSLVYIA